jgi:nucleoside diphosphate kinase
MICAGSLFFKDLPEDPPNEAAKEGTAAGEYLEHLLNENLEIPTHARNGVMFDDDMKLYAHQVVANVNSLRSSPVTTEHKIDWSTQCGVWVKGKYDLSFWSKGDLYVDDYKYGWGIVEPEENWQLLAYGIGRMLQLKNIATPSSIVLRIHQPRPHHERGMTREWHLSLNELMAYKDKIEARMLAIVNGENSLVTGPQCRYCPAASLCPSFSRAFYRGVEAVTDFVQDQITQDELSFQLDLVGRIEELVKIKKSSLETLAVDRIKRGQLIPNYLTEERIGDRKWKKHISPEAIKMMTGKDIVEQVMLSPAKAEKMGVPKELIASMVERPVLGHKLKRVDTVKKGNEIFGTIQPKEVTSGR